MHKIWARCCAPHGGGPFGSPTCADVGGTCTSSPYGCFGTLPTAATCDGFETCCSAAPDPCSAAGRLCTASAFCPTGFVTASDTPCGTAAERCCSPDPNACAGICVPSFGCPDGYMSAPGNCSGLATSCCTPLPPPSCEDLGGHARRPAARSTRSKQTNVSAMETPCAVYHRLRVPRWMAHAVREHAPAGPRCWTTAPVRNGWMIVVSQRNRGRGERPIDR